MMLRQGRLILVLLLGGCACIPDTSATQVSTKSPATNHTEIPGCRILDATNTGVHKITCEDGRSGFHLARE